MTIADVPALLAVRTAVRENHLSLAELTALGITHTTLCAALEQGHYLGWVGGVAGDATVCGFGLAEPATGYVFALFVLPEAEGYGLGGQLLPTLEDALRAAGHNRAWLLTSPGYDLRARRFYEKRGWQAIRLEADGQLRVEKAL